MKVSPDFSSWKLTREGMTDSTFEDIEMVSNKEHMPSVWKITKMMLGDVNKTNLANPEVVDELIVRNGTHQIVHVLDSMEVWGENNKPNVTDVIDRLKARNVVGSVPKQTHWYLHDQVDRVVHQLNCSSTSDIKMVETLEDMRIRFPKVR